MIIQLMESGVSEAAIGLDSKPTGSKGYERSDLKRKHGYFVLTTKPENRHTICIAFAFLRTGHLLENSLVEIIKERYESVKINMNGTMHFSIAYVTI